jgi:hypothetical protein
MPFCPNCGADVEDNQKFCPECGTRLKTTEQNSVFPPPPPPPSVVEPNESATTTPPPPQQYNNVPPPPPLANQYGAQPQKQGILGRVDIDHEDIDEVAEKAKKGLGAAWRLARRGISKGAELASQGIEAAKETIDERRGPQNGAPQTQSYQAPAPAPAPAPGAVKYCPTCGQPAAPGKFCNNCGHKLE